MRNAVRLRAWVEKVRRLRVCFALTNTKNPGGHMHNLLQKLMLGGSTAALVAAAPLAGAFAQGGNTDVEQVVVSASRITIAGYTQPTPVTVVGAAQLEEAAKADITDSSSFSISAIRPIPSSPQAKLPLSGPINCTPIEAR